MKIEFESFNQMQFRHIINIIAALAILWSGFKYFAKSLFCFVAETALFPIAKSRRAKAAYIRKVWRTRDATIQKLRGYRGNGFMVNKAKNGNYIQS